MGTGVRTAMATRRGVREFNMDSPAVFASAGGLVAAAVVDGNGNDGNGAFVIRRRRGAGQPRASSHRTRSTTTRFWDSRIK